MFERTHPVAQAAQAHGRASYPHEAAGLVVDGAYVPCENIAQDPTTGFVLDDCLVLEYGDRIQGLIHSHPEDWPVPTALDMRQQQAMGVPWGIYSVRADDAGKTGGEPLNTSSVVWFGDGAPKGPLVGRGFLHGHQDCVSLILDWHRLQGIEMPEPPRDWGWWLSRTDEKTGEVTPAGDLYRDNFAAYGFERIEGPKPGAVFLVALGRGADRKPNMIPNHGGVYLSPTLVLHHLTGLKPIELETLSIRDPSIRRGNCDPVWVIHKDLPKTLRAIP